MNRYSFEHFEMKGWIDNRGRGTVSQPGNRFESHYIELDPGAREEISQTDPDFVKTKPETKCLLDDSQSIISKNTSPDIGFTYSLNPYRGCEHGCSYCYARPTHEYLGFNAGLDFETRLMVKKEASFLLEQELAKKSWKPATLACSGVTDCYQPVERSFQITRACLGVLRDFRNPVGIITKNALVTRDIDLLSEMAHHNAAAVSISLTSLDSDLAGRLEPRASRPESRLAAIRQLREAGIPTGVSLAPIIPGLNDHEIPALLEAAKESGAVSAGYTVLRLPYGVKEIFAEWLEQHFPDKKAAILGRVREMRGGRLNQSTFGARLSGTGRLADEIRQLFQVSLRRYQLKGESLRLDTSHFRRRSPGQPELFD